MVVVALIAPLISVNNPTDFNLLDARQAPSWHHLFGTTDQGSDIFSQVMLGARRSLILGAAAGALATVLAAVLGILAAYAGGIIDEIVNFLTNIFLVIPTIPLLIVVSGYLKARGHEDDDPRARPDALGVRGAHPAGQALSLEEPRLRPGGEGGGRVDAGASSSAS